MSYKRNQIPYRAEVGYSHIEYKKYRVVRVTPKGGWIVSYLLEPYATYDTIIKRGDRDWMTWIPTDARRASTSNTAVLELPVSETPALKVGLFNFHE